MFNSPRLHTIIGDIELQCIFREPKMGSSYCSTVSFGSDSPQKGHAKAEIEARPGTTTANLPVEVMKEVFWYAKRWIEGLLPGHALLELIQVCGNWRTVAKLWSITGVKKRGWVPSTSSARPAARHGSCGPNPMHICKRVQPPDAAQALHSFVNMLSAIFPELKIVALALKDVEARGVVKWIFGFMRGSIFVRCYSARPSPTYLFWANDCRTSWWKWIGQNQRCWTLMKGYWTCPYCAASFQVSSKQLSSRV